jgi:tetratricopeptide (TPR) repeat protein
MGSHELPEVRDKMAGGLARYKYYLRERPVLLVLLSLLAILFFLAVTGLSRAYHSQREALGSRWFSRGITDLNAKRFDAAVTEFRSALLYSRDDYSYQLNLAEALIGLKHTGEASAYLRNLWEREPEDGLVNLELARIAAQQGQTDQAVRYYHDAVYAAWTADEEQKRREARLELIELLLRTHAQAQAQAELIALSENVGDDPAEQQSIGDLFLQAHAYEHALAAYRMVLNSDQHNLSALAGAGTAAFELGRYPIAQHYFQAVVAGDPNDTKSADQLKTTEMVLHMDPYRPDISTSERIRIVTEAFAAAGERLKTCNLPAQPSAGSLSSPSLEDSWMELKPKITEAALQRNPNLVDTAMDLVFRVERQTSAACGTPTGTDLALLLIAKSHEGS